MWVRKHAAAKGSPSSSVLSGCNNISREYIHAQEDERKGKDHEANIGSQSDLYIVE